MYMFVHLSILTPVPEVSGMYLQHALVRISIHVFHVKHWSRMQNAEDLGVFYQCDD